MLQYLYSSAKWSSRKTAHIPCQLRRRLLDRTHLLLCCLALTTPYFILLRSI